MCMYIYMYMYVKVKFGTIMYMLNMHETESIVLQWYMHVLV